MGPVDGVQLWAGMGGVEHVGDGFQPDVESQHLPGTVREQSLGPDAVVDALSLKIKG